MDRGDDENFVEEIEIPAETLKEDFTPKPVAKSNGQGGGSGDGGGRSSGRSDIPGREELERQIQRLTRSEEETKRRAQTAEEALAATQRRSTEEITRARQEVGQTRKREVETARTAIEAVLNETEAGLKAAKIQFAQAYSAGDGEALAEAQSRISELTVAKHENKRRLDDLPTKDALEAETAEMTQPPKPKTPQDAFEQYVGQFKPRAQQFLRKHPKLASDPRLNRKLGVAHDDALADGLTEETDEYFEFLEDKLGFTQNDDYFEDGGEPPPRQQRQERREERTMPTREQQRGTDGGGRQYTENRNNRPMRSAPVRGGSDVGRVSGGRVRVGLTEGEISHATDGSIVWGEHNAPRPELVGEPIGTTEMARRKAMIKQGKAGKLTYNIAND
jgi:hypothetical protein